MADDPELAEALKRVREELHRAAEDKQAQDKRRYRKQPFLARFLWRREVDGGRSPGQYIAGPAQQGKKSQLDIEMVRWTRAVASYTKWLVIVGAIAAAVAYFTLRAIQGQLDAMDADQRPWIKVEKIEPLSYPKFQGMEFGGLEFAKPDFVGFLPLHIEIKNVGHSPAFNIQVGVWPFYGYGQKDLNLPKVERERCDTISKNLMPMPIVTDGANYIRVLFPDSIAPYDNAALGLLPDDIKKFSYGEAPEKKVFQLWFYGCVIYNINGSLKPHQTSFAYRVGHKVKAVGTPDGAAEDVTFKPWESIPSALLIFEQRPTAAGDTN